MSRPKINNYFPGGNTAIGFYSFYQYLPYKTDKTFILKGGPGTGKSTLMKKIGYEMTDHGYDIEFHWCSSDNNSLDGVVIPALRAAVHDGTAPHLIDPINPGAVEEIVNLGEFWDSEHLFKHRQEIIRTNQLIKDNFEKVYRYLKAASIICNEWESYYIERLDITRVNQKTAALTSQLLGEKSFTASTRERHLFASAITPGGYVNHFENLTSDLDQRYLIKGQPGTGKSTLIKKVGDALFHNGYEIIYFHSALNPEKIEGIIVPEKKLSIVNAAPPHNFKATKDGDQIIDMNSCVNMAAVRQFSEEIKKVENLFQQIMNQAYLYLKEAKSAHDQLEEFYVAAMDFNGVEAKRRFLIKEILAGEN